MLAIYWYSHGLRCGRRGGPNVHLQDRGSARHELLRSEQLIAKKRRNKLAAADKAICYFTRGKFRVDRHDDGYTDTWVEHELRQVAAEQRTAEASSGGAATNAAVAEFEEGLEQAA